MKKELMENFKPGDGTNEPIGKLTFGKDYEGVSMEWYILGADTGIGDGNNIAVFGITPIIANQVFEMIMRMKKRISQNSACMLL